MCELVWTMVIGRARRTACDEVLDERKGEVAEKQ